MKKKYYAKFIVKDRVMKSELARAHGMIVLLVITLMATLVLSSAYSIELDPALTFVAVILLAVVGIISLSVVTTVTKKRK